MGIKTKIKNIIPCKAIEINKGEINSSTFLVGCHKKNSINGNNQIIVNKPAYFFLFKIENPDRRHNKLIISIIDP